MAYDANEEMESQEGELCEESLVRPQRCHGFIEEPLVRTARQLATAAAAAGCILVSCATTNAFNAGAETCDATCDAACAIDCAIG